MKSLDSIKLQRLIDGELEYSEVQLLLANAEHQFDDWKAIATGFIENQMFASQFNSIDRENSAAPQVEHSNGPDISPLPRYWLLALAASALMTLSIGMLIGSTYFGGSPENFGVTPLADAGNSLVENRDADQPASQPAVYRMQLHDDQGNQFIDTDIPFYQVADWNDIDQHRIKEYPADIRNRVRKSGYDLQQNTRYLQGRLNDGRRFVIPVRNTKFAPYQ